VREYAHISSISQNEGREVLRLSVCFSLIAAAIWIKSVVKRGRMGERERKDGREESSKEVRRRRERKKEKRER
jgi:hypothetical protein